MDYGKFAWKVDIAEGKKKRRKEREKAKNQSVVKTGFNLICMHLYSEKRSGPSTEPWGTPHVIVC